MIIGLTGRMAAGKGTLADVLIKHGFSYQSLRDEIRKELRLRGIPESRTNLTEIGNAMRREDGPGALAIRALASLDADIPSIVDSIRNPEEVRLLRASGLPFLLARVDAPPHIRYERLVARGRVGDVTSLEEFQAQEKRELESADPTTQQLIATEELADCVLVNDCSLSEFQERVKEWLDSL